MLRAWRNTPLILYLSPNFVSRVRKKGKNTVMKNEKEQIMKINYDTNAFGT